MRPDAMRVPVATFRVQLNHQFQFADARRVTSYLQSLGFSDLYASPVFQACRGSAHGYDVTDPTQLNPELGGEQEFNLLVQELKSRGMGLVLDIIPNHMAASPENPWWMDVLENGPSSRYARYFNVEWRPVVAKGALEDKVLLPMLGDYYGRVLENQELMLAVDQGGFFIRYHDLRLPLDPKTYEDLVTGPMDLAEAIGKLPSRSNRDPMAVGRRRRESQAIKRRIWQLYSEDAGFRRAIDERLAAFNGCEGDPQSFDALDQLLSEQAYRPAFWRLATEEINYWRFFDVTELVGLRNEDPDVFGCTHSLILRLVREGKVTGLRVDHIDGLYDPFEYLRRLRHCAGDQYLIVEKILGGDEMLPADWPVAGTTGYDFLNVLNGVFAHPQGWEQMRQHYGEFTGIRESFCQVAYEQKKRIIGEVFRGELRSLRHELGSLADQDRHGRDLSPKDLVEALADVTASLPVYRTYIRDFDVSERDRATIEQAIAQSRRRNPHIDPAVFDFVERVLLLAPPLSISQDQRDPWLRFVMRWQQFTGPVTAKGLEDTALYVYNVLASLNEVGGGRPSTVEEFHRFNQLRRERWPSGMNATSTHDTKRSEDVRARINVLSEMPDFWARRVRRWSHWNRPKKRTVHGQLVPDANEEIFLYQTLVGAWPFEAGERPAFDDRLKAYLLKASREAKVHTSWIHPDPEHERAFEEFAMAILDDSGPNRFLADFTRFQRMIAYYGAIGSLAQVLLKIASPGVPDFYQSTLLWDLSLVDPDNRRPADYSKGMALLETFKNWTERNAAPLVRELMENWQDGSAKLYLTWKALNFRKAESELFVNGDYQPLFASGDRRENVVAFARRLERRWVIVAVPRFVSRFSPAERPPLGRRRWGDTVLELPDAAPALWHNLLTGESLRASAGIPLRWVFNHFPVALLAGGPQLGPS